MAVSVTFKDLVKVFGQTRAVDSITLAINPGELFFLLGPSGCGKTTLLRCIAGFAEPDSGTIYIGEDDVTHMPPHKRDTGMVFQSYALWPHMTVKENVAFGLEMRKVAKSDMNEQVDRALRMVKMTDRADYRPNQLSGGQQQRVALARALVVRPKCLLLDEPLSNLDAKLRLEMRSEIRRICKESDLTAVYVTHDQKEALSIADRIAVLNEGKIQQCAEPRELYELPHSKFVAHFIGETNFMNAQVIDVKGRTVHLDTPIGEVLTTSPTAEGMSPGTRASVSLRPEVIRLNAPPKDAVNVFQGEVHDTVYLGEVAQHQVNIPAVGPGIKEGRLQVKAMELNPKILARDGSETAQIWFDTADVIVLKS